MDSLTQLELHEALSGIFGTISLVTWGFLTVPQLALNYKNGNAEGLSLAFLAIWVLGDLANLIGAVWAKLVPTVIALGAWFTLADSILLIQCIYYDYLSRTSSDKDLPPGSGPTESDPLLERSTPGQENGAQPEEIGYKYPEWVSNTLSIIAVLAGGFVIWVIFFFAGIWIPTPAPGDAEDPVQLALAAQVLGYLSAAAYLGARIPQIWKNYREKSCEGLSLLFFILSLQGNLTYGLSILCHSLNGDYLITNLPWLLGSLGTMAEDATIFIQFRIYKKLEKSAIGQANGTD